MKFGDDNIVIFGVWTKHEVYDHYARHDYDSRGVYEDNPVIRRVVDSL